MVKLSSRFDYALRALVDLALHQATGPVTVKAIAKRQGIPTRYLEQLFNRLRREEIVLAERGPRGGYRLRLPADQIPVSAVFRSLEIKAANGKRKPASRGGGSDPAGSLWRQVEAAVQTTLQATTLEDLAAKARDQAPNPLNHRFTFHI